MEDNVEFSREVCIFYKKHSDYSPIQARWLFSDAVTGKQVTLEVISKVCMCILQCTFAIRPHTRILTPPPTPPQPVQTHGFSHYETTEPHRAFRIVAPLVSHVLLIIGKQGAHTL